MVRFGMSDHINDYDYALPPTLIAQHPAHERIASRLLRLSEAGLEDRQFRDLPSYVAPGDLLEIGRASCRERVCLAV